MRTSWQFGTCPPGRENSWRKAHRKSALWTGEEAMADGQQHSTKADRVEEAAVKFSALKVTEGSSVCAEVKLQLPARHPSAFLFSSSQSPCALQSCSLGLLGEATRMPRTYDSLFTCSSECHLSAQMDERPPPLNPCARSLKSARHGVKLAARTESSSQ